MNPEVLDQLRDIHLPPGPSWWPPAPGWIAVLAVLAAIVAAVAAARICRRLTHRRRLRRLALDELGRIEHAFTGHGDRRRLLADVSVLMKRLMLSNGGRDDAGRLSGARWIERLNAARPVFEGEMAELMVDGPYRPAVEFEPELLVGRARRWIRGYRP